MNNKYSSSAVSYKNSISLKLLRAVLSIYFCLTLFVTAIQVGVEYYATKNDINEVLIASEKTFHDILAAALWNMDREQLKVSVDSIVNLPHIIGVEVSDESLNQEHYHVGEVSNDKGDSSLFGHEFSLSYKHVDKVQIIGTVKLYSNESVIFNRLKASIITLFINACIKTFALVALFILVFNKYLTRPLGELTKKANDIDVNNIGGNRIDVCTTEKDEIGVLQKALNVMMDKTADTISELDNLNKSLEKRVKERTQEVSEALGTIERERSTLKMEVKERKKSQVALQESLDTLKQAQTQLVESEKMASLGGLVAGVAHEINTPVGLSLTGVSHFEVTLKEIEEKFNSGELEEQDFTEFVDESKTIAKTIHSSLDRAANLVKSFKQVAVDQSHEELREFDVVTYLDEVMGSLASSLKRKHIEFSVETDESHILLFNYPGAWAQIFTNLTQNSSIHAYDEGMKGKIVFNFQLDGDELLFVYKDDGKGMTEETLAKIYEPFYTTNRGGGGSGLGMNILFNIVTQKMKGTIHVESTIGEGTTFIIRVPTSIKAV